MKLYECIIDDGTNVFKTVTAAKSKKELLNVYGGNGTFEKIKDITKDTQHMGVECLRDSDKNRMGRNGDNATHSITTTTFRFNQVKEGRP